MPKKPKQIEDKTLEEVSTKLNVIISLMLRQLLGDTEFAKRAGRKQRVGEITRYLAEMGLDAQDIAEITGAPVTSIRTF